LTISTISTILTFSTTPRRFQLMKTAVKVGLSLLPAVLAVAVCLFWGCQNEPVADFSEETRIVDVVGELAGSDSQAEAEAAIRNLLNKAEMGTAFPGSRYEAYEFSDEDIADLAELHLLYLNGEFEPSLAHTFEAMMRVADDMSMPRMEFDSAASMFQGQTADALADPEEPGNALLVAIAAEDGKIPGTAPSYNEATVRSPVQTVLFGLWFDVEFGSLPEGGSAELAPAEKDPEKVCRKKCFKDFIIDFVWCIHNYPSGPERDECIEAARDEFEECLQDCHDQGKSSG
jgi:hypothetical protein